MASWFDSLVGSRLSLTDSQVNVLVGSDPGRLEADFAANAHIGFKRNGAVFTLVATRAMTLKGARFAYRTVDRPRKLERGPELLETPWVGGSTAQLIARMDVDVSLGGNSYWRIEGGELRWMRPDWVRVIVVEGELLGYAYYEGGEFTGKRPVALLRDEVAHYKPIPDPLHPYMGVSWMVAVAEDIDADAQMTHHKRRFFKNAAVPGLAVLTKKKLGPDEKTALRESFQARYEGSDNAYKTMFLEGDADIRVVGTDLKSLNFSAIQGAGETRLAAAAMVPAIVAGFSEGMAAGTYSNYGLAVRKYADGFLRPTWEDMAGVFAPLMPKRDGLELWFDDRDVALLQQDKKDEAEIVKEQALTIESLIRAGFEPESVKEAVIAGSFENLIHSGLVSVQLLPPGEDSPNSGDPDE